MDYQLDNVNLSLNEKNKRNFAGLYISNKNEDTEELNKKAINTFQVYSSFIKEKDGLLSVVNNIKQYSLIECNSVINLNTKNLAADSSQIKSLDELLDYKNKTIMIINLYQEQPGLLDPIIDKLTTPLVDALYEIIKTLIFVDKENNKESKEEKNNDFLRHSLLIICKAVSQILYVLCKVRGYDVISKYFSSEVHVFEPIITFMLRLVDTNDDAWQTIYILLLWTSILGLIPFDIETIDTSGVITNNLMNFYVKALTMSSNLRDISSYSASKFLTRKDIIQKNLLKDYINLCLETLKKQTNNDVEVFLIVGMLSSLALIFKNGSRTDMMCYVETIINNIIDVKFIEELENSNLVRKFKISLAGKIGLIILKPKDQIWRYKITFKNLIKDDLAYNNDISSINNNNNNNNNKNSSDIDIDVNYDYIENIIQCVLEGITDKDSIVRWTASKAIGRICERLDKSMIQDILNEILNNFDISEENYLQGSCLAIAELIKRGLVLPDQLENIVNLLSKALIYEENKGGFCVGSQVRDSACYVVWALARAYSPEVMREHVKTLSNSLILTILFDKVVNIRRAASAAFQEHVGRQGYFPHGIEIITEADYFTLGNITNCYLNISLFISQYEEYYSSILNYLSNDRLFHSDINIRQNAAECLSLILPFNFKYILDNNNNINNNIDDKKTKIQTSVQTIHNLFNNIINNKVFSSNLNTRHGALIGLGYLIISLKGHWDYEYNSRIIRVKVLESLSLSEKKILEDSDYKKAFDAYYSNLKHFNALDNILLKEKNLENNKTFEEINEKLIKLPQDLVENNYLKIKGAEVMRSGINEYIKLLAISQINISSTSSYLSLVNILLDNMKHPKIKIIEEASNALSYLMDNYYENLVLNYKEEFTSQINLIFLNALNISVNDESVYVTRGYSMAISCFNINIILNNLEETIKCLITNCAPKTTENNDAQTRAISINSLAIIIIKILNKCNDLSVINKINAIDNIFKTFINGFNDYQIDNKLGDVGSKVREACIVVYPNLMIKLLEKRCYKEFKNYAMIYIKNILKQICEKYNNIRFSAGNSLELFFRKLVKLQDSSDNEYNNEHKDIITSTIACYDVLASIFIDTVDSYKLINVIEHEKVDMQKLTELNNMKQSVSSTSRSLIEKSNNTLWLDPSFTFKNIIQLIYNKEYFEYIFSGLIYSIGSITDDVSKNSKECLENVITSKTEKDNNNYLVEDVFKCILRLFENNKKDDNVVVSLYSCINILTSKSIFININYLKYISEIQKYMISENLNSTNIHKILICPDIYYNILFYDKENSYKCHERALRSLLFLMMHKYPIVRKKAADKLYLYLLSVEDPETLLGIDQDTIDNLGILLADADWGLPIKTIVDTRNEISNMLKIDLKQKASN